MKILLAADGSPYSLSACQYLIDHRQHYGDDCAVTVMHVAQPLPVDVEVALGESGDGGLVRYYQESHAEAFKTVCERLDKAGIAYTRETDMGTPGERLAHYAEQQKMDLIIMGSHGRGAFSSLVLGSVAARVLSACKVPVLIIR